MQNITFKYPVNIIERLFIEKGSELLYKDSIDTYRLKLHNPKTLIEELISVCFSAKNGVLTNNDYANATSAELIKLLNENNDGLNFSKVNRNHYLTILKETKKENYDRIIQSSKIILKDNTNYVEVLFDNIKGIIDTYDIAEPDEATSKNIKKNLIVLQNYKFIELINKGFNKQYLYYFFQVIFIYNKNINLTFSERYEIFKSLNDRSKEKFQIIYTILGKSFQFKEFNKIDESYIQIGKRERSILKNKASEKVNSYLEENKLSTLISMEVEAFDYYKAIEISRDKISKDIDIYHLGFNSHQFEIGKQAVVIGENDPSKSETFPGNYQIDGYIRSSTFIFETLLTKVKKIKQNNINEDSYDKLISAIRYLRTGTESPELETKLLNYWIGLEYIFTSFNSDEKTIDRIRKYFPVCHSLIYVKRNLYDFHKAIERLNVQGSIPDYNDNLHYLNQHNSYNLIIANTDNQLLKFRAKYFQKWVENPSNIDLALKSHSDNLKWNLTRIYRIRNEIVHNAAIKNGIYVNISHMKYYLTFILNSILDFMAENNIDTNNDGNITIEDYFIAQDIMLGSVKKSTLINYINIENPNQILH